MLPDAVRHTGAFAGSYSGFSVPGIEIYEHDCRTGEPCIPCEVDEGDLCRARWVNRQDHGYLTRVNIARASHPNAPYCCPERGYQCYGADLRTTVFPEPGAPNGAPPPGNGFTPGPKPFSGAAQAERREQVRKLREGAKARAMAGRRVHRAHDHQAVAGNAYMRQRQSWGNHARHTENIEHTEPVGIRYTPMAGQNQNGQTAHHQVGLTMEGDFDCLIMAPGHVRCDFYED